ncbi:MAG: thioredoxin domain-containing protein [Nitrososphaerota archaeon]
MGNILDVNYSNWDQQVLHSKILTVVDFWHERCPWCIRLDPILNEVSEEYEGKIRFVKLNILSGLNNREIAIRYGVMGTPTLVFFCGGRPVEHVIGFVPKERLKRILDDMLVRHMECFAQSTELKS